MQTQPHVWLCLHIHKRRTSSHTTQTPSSNVGLRRASGRPFHMHLGGMWVWNALAIQSGQPHSRPFDTSMQLMLGKRSAVVCVSTLYTNTYVEVYIDSQRVCFGIHFMVSALVQNVIDILVHHPGFGASILARACVRPMRAIWAVRHVCWYRPYACTLCISACMHIWLL